jgi:prepilin-type N-terminal cleavage/methylation domain-containing protein
MPNKPKPSSRAFTLVELLAVVAIVATIALIAVSRTSGISGKAKMTAAERDLRTIAAAIADEGGYLADMRGIPGFSPALFRMANLFIPTNVYGRAEGREWPGGVRVDDVRRPGCAAPAEFVRWSNDAERGWRGPYLRFSTGAFPAAGDVRREGDATFAERGFYPDVSGLRIPDDFKSGRDGCSVYGFPGEPAVFDPWGNPYVIQIPPPQAFPDAGGSNADLPDEARLAYARVVSAGPDGILDTPCFASTSTNVWSTDWSERSMRLRRQAGLVDGDDRRARGDDLVWFLMRNDIDEGEGAMP